MLHTVNKSTFSDSALDECVKVAKKGSSILLIEDGVYAAQVADETEARVKAIAEKFKVFALGPDLEARGITRLVKGIEVIDYAGFVTLVEENKVTTWV